MKKVFIALLALVVIVFAAGVCYEHSKSQNQSVQMEQPVIETLVTLGADSTMVNDFILVKGGEKYFDLIQHSLRCQENSSIKYDKILVSNISKFNNVPAFLFLKENYRLCSSTGTHNMIRMTKFCITS